jgi:hypothetical protein
MVALKRPMKAPEGPDGAPDRAPTVFPPGPRQKYLVKSTVMSGRDWDSSRQFLEGFGMQDPRFISAFEELLKTLFSRRSVKEVREFASERLAEGDFFLRNYKYPTLEEFAAVDAIRLLGCKVTKEMNTNDAFRDSLKRVAWRRLRLLLTDSKRHSAVVSKLARINRRVDRDALNKLPRRHRQELRRVLQILRWQSSMPFTEGSRVYLVGPFASNEASAWDDVELVLTCPTFGDITPKEVMREVLTTIGRMNYSQVVRILSLEREEELPAGEGPAKCIAEW